MGETTNAINVNNLSFENQNGDQFGTRSERVSEWATEQNEDWSSRKDNIQVETREDYFVQESQESQESQLSQSVKNQETNPISHDFPNEPLTKKNLLISQDYPSSRISRNSKQSSPIDPRIAREGQRLKDQNVYGQVHNFNARKALDVRASVGSKVYLSNANKMISIEYYDQYLNMERKMCHLFKVIGKIRLRIIQKPFIILDMLKLFPQHRSGTNIMSSLLTELIQLRRRRALDSIVDYVEKKKQINARWARMAEDILSLRKKQIRREIEIQKRREHRNKRSGAKKRRSVRLMGSILGCLFRDMSRSVFEEIIVFGAGRAEFGHNTPKIFEIQGQQNFLKEKANVLVSSPNNAPQLDQIDTQADSLKNKPQSRFEGSFSARQNQMNAYYDPENKKRAFESSFEVNDPNKLTNDINAKIAMVQRALNDNGSNPNEPVAGFEAGMDTLTHLTQLMQMLKKYFEQVKQEGDPDTERAHKAKFQQVLKMLKKLINLILAKMSNTHPGAFASQQSSQMDDTAAAHEKRESNINIMTDLQIQLNKEIGDIRDIINPGGFSQGQDNGEGGQQMEFGTEAGEGMVEENNGEARGNVRTTFGNVMGRRESDIEPNLGFQRRESGDFEGMEQDAFKSGNQSQNTEGYQSVGNFNHMLEEITENLFNLNMNLEQNVENAGNEEENMQNGPNLNSKNSNFNSFENGQQLSNEFSSQDVLSNQRQDPPANQDFPLFQNNSPPQNTKNLSFRKKFNPKSQPHYQQEGLPEIYARSEFFNFYGVLNFKVRKYNRRLVRQAFEDIFQRSVDFESRIKVFACGQLIKKDRFFLDLDRLKNEVNRRNFIRKNTIFKLYHAQNMKRSEVFHAFRFNRDHPVHPEDLEYDDRYERDLNTYSAPDQPLPHRNQVQSQVPLHPGASQSMYNHNVAEDPYNDQKFTHSVRNNFYPPANPRNNRGNMFYRDQKPINVQSQPNFDPRFNPQDMQRNQPFQRSRDHRLMQTQGNIPTQNAMREYHVQGELEDEMFRQGQPAPRIPSLQNANHYNDPNMGGYYPAPDFTGAQTGELQGRHYEEQGNYNPFEVYDLEHGGQTGQQYYQGNDEYMVSQHSAQNQGNQMSQQNFQREQMEGIYREEQLSQAQRPESQQHHQIGQPGPRMYDPSGTGDLRIGSGTQRPMIYSQRQDSKLSLRNDYGIGPFPGSGDAYSVKSLQHNVFMNRTEDDCLYMNLEEEYLHKVSKRQKRDNSISINKSMQDYK